MRKESSIQLEEGLRFTPELTRFYNRCAEWTEKLSVALNGGISVKFWIHGMIAPTASFWWRGQEITRIALSGEGLRHGRGDWKEVIKPEEVWRKLFRPKLIELLLAEATRIDELTDRVDGFDWQSGKPAK